MQEHYLSQGQSNDQIGDENVMCKRQAYNNSKAEQCAIARNRLREYVHERTE